MARGPFWPAWMRPLPAPRDAVIRVERQYSRAFRSGCRRKPRSPLRRAYRISICRVLSQYRQYAATRPPLHRFFQFRCHANPSELGGTSPARRWPCSALSVPAPPVSLHSNSSRHRASAFASAGVVGGPGSIRRRGPIKISGQGACSTTSMWRTTTSPRSIFTGPSVMLTAST